MVEIFIDMRFLFLTIILVLSIFVTSCALLQQHNGPATKLEAQSRARIVNVEDQINSNTSQKLDVIAGFSFATGYALNQVTNPPQSVKVAIDLNKRIGSITGSPTLEIMKDMQDMVDKLISQAGELQLDGARKMAIKDAQITELQNQSKQLASEKDAEIRSYMNTAAIVASSADAYKDALSEYQGWFGLKAVVKGLIQFIKSSTWVLLGGGFIFLILRLLASSNPIAGAIFSVIDTFFSWIINIIKVIAPRALAVANTVGREVYDSTKGTLTTLVDSIETSKIQSTASGKQSTLQDVLNTAELTMTPDDKALVDKIKIELGWAKPSVASTVSPISKPVVPVVSPSVVPIPVVPVAITTPTTASVAPVGEPLIPNPPVVPTSGSIA